MEPSDAYWIAASIDEPAAFGAIFDRHASTMLRYFARRVEPAAAEGLLGEVFRIVFEQRASFDPVSLLGEPARGSMGSWPTSWVVIAAVSSAGCTPWLDSQPDNALIRTMPLESSQHARSTLSRAGRELAVAVDDLPAVERETLLLFGCGEPVLRRHRRCARRACRDRALADLPWAYPAYVNTTRSSTPDYPRPIPRRPPPMTDYLDPLRRLRADDLLPTDPPDAELLVAARRRLLAGIAGTSPDDPAPLPSVYLRLAYRDERAALEFLQCLLFGFREINPRPASNTPTECWHGSSSATG